MCISLKIQVSCLLEPACLMKLLGPQKVHSLVLLIQVANIARIQHLFFRELLPNELHECCIDSIYAPKLLLQYLLAVFVLIRLRVLLSEKFADIDFCESILR